MFELHIDNFSFNDVNFRYWRCCLSIRYPGSSRQAWSQNGLAGNGKCVPDAWYSSFIQGPKAGIQAAVVGPAIPFSRARLPVSSVVKPKPMNMQFLGQRVFWILCSANLIQALGNFIPTLYIPCAWPYLLSP